MENNEKQIMERLEAATSLLERDAALAGRTAEPLRARWRGFPPPWSRAGARRNWHEKLAGGRTRNRRAESRQQPSAVLNPLRRTFPASTSEMLAKHGIADGPVDVRTLDAALAGLSLEQRIAVKSQLLRAGAIAVTVSYQLSFS